ncbi:hypothetical protein C8R47DRAFT_1065995 [Mycena vitilis]|nr:hypothetical protein C8R47DRAFT_1065995 [Mycena vitilis]
MQLCRAQNVLLAQAEHGCWIETWPLGSAGQLSAPWQPRPGSTRRPPRRVFEMVQLGVVFVVVMKPTELRLCQIASCTKPRTKSLASWIEQPISSGTSTYVH